MLWEFEKDENGIAFLDGTGINEADLLTVVFNFASYAEDHRGSNLVEFFDGKKFVKKPTLKALALLGLKYCVSSYASIIRENEKNKAAAKEEEAEEDVKADNETGAGELPEPQTDNAGN